MMVLIMCVAGALAGTFTGLVPGIHVNTLASIMLVAYPTISAGISQITNAEWIPVLVSSLIISASVVHSFVDFVPSVFTGAPDPDEVMNVLPGHRLLMEGYGMAAVRSAAIGSAIGACCAILLAVPVQYLMLNGLADKLDMFTSAVVMFVLSVMIINERENRHWCVLIMIISGIMGLICMRGNIPSNGILGNGTLLFPLLSGLFGMPALILSAKNGKIPPQRDYCTDPVGPAPGIKGVIMGCLAGWYPGITSTAGASLASSLTPENDPARFISMVASIGTVTTIFSLITLSVSGSGRSGTVLVIKEIVGDDISGFCSETFFLLLISVALASVLGYYLTIASGKLMSSVADKIELSSLNKGIMIFVGLLVLLLTGPYGLIILFVSTVIGFIPISVNISRIPLTGCLMIPVLLDNFGFANVVMSTIMG